MGREGAGLPSFFLHVDGWHLAGNLYFLVLFGVCVEQDLGPARFLLLTALSALVGDLLFVAASAGSQVPSVGASGGIAGILAYWALAFPTARVRILLILVPSPATLHLSARTAVGIWLALQVFGTVRSGGGPGINYLAHLGGAAVGAAAWLAGPEGPWAGILSRATIGEARRSRRAP